MEEEFFTVEEGKTIYLCCCNEKGYRVLAHRRKGRWLRYRNPFFWGLDLDPEHRPERACITKAEVTAIFLMGKSEAET